MKRSFTIFALLCCFAVLTTAAWAATVTSTATGGNWSATTTWVGGVLPGASDDVVIADGATVIIDQAVTVMSLSVGQSGSILTNLIFDGVAARNVVVTGDVTVAAADSFMVQVTGTFTNTLSIGGNLTNNGTFDMSRNTSTTSCNVTFTKNGDQVVTGTGMVTRFRGITLNKTALANKVTCNINASLSLSGGFIFTHGTWEQTADTFFVTAGNQNITGDGAVNIIGSASWNQPASTCTTSTGGSLTVNTSGTVTVGGGNNKLNMLGGTLTLTSGTVIVGGSFTLAGGSTTINGANIIINQQVGSTTASAGNNAFDLQAAASLTMSSGSVTFGSPNAAATDAARSGRDLKIAAPSTGVYSITGGTFYMGDGNTTPVSGATGYTISNSSTVAIPNLVIQGGGVTGRNVLLVSNITINGTLTLVSDTIKFNGKTITMGATSTLMYAGTVAQTTGAELPASLNNLTINNAAGVTLGSATTVSGTLTLTSGNITTGANTLAIASTGSVARTSGYVVGNLQKAFAVGSNVAQTFELGSGSVYAPINVAFNNVTTAGGVTASTTSGDHPNILTSGVDINKDVNRYWTLANSGVGFDTYSAVLNYGASEVDPSAVPANFLAKGYSGSVWGPLTIASPTSTSAQITGVTGFGDVVLGEKAGFIITATASVGGTISPSGTVPISFGLDTTFTIAANAGHSLDSVVVDGTNLGAITTYKFTNVIAAHSIAAYFTAEKRTILVTAGVGGTIAPADSAVVDYGTDTTFTITPSTGKQVDSVLVDGVNVGAVTSYKFVNVTAAHTIAAYFSTSKYIIAATAFGGGTISPNGAVVILYGTDTTFTITANVGSNIDSVVVDGVSQGSITTYKFTSAAAAHTIKAYFSSPNLTLASSNFAFGTMLTGTTMTDTVVVTNNGSASLSITNVAAADTHFVATPATATIAVAASQKFAITFKADTGIFTSNVIFTSNTLKGLDTVTVSGSGFEKISVSHARMVAGGSTKISTYVQGVITRALSGSNYIRIQDTTGGATLYGTSSLKDSITSGAIKPGDVVYVHGLGTTYSNLQEISTMVSWTKIKSDTVPAPVVLTLAQLIANAEYYESMLVQLNNVSTTGASPFAAGVNYGLTDATETTGAIKLYVHAGESNIIGVAVPTSTFDVTGVMTQYSTTYEITPVLATDIQIVTGINGTKTGIPTTYELSNNYPNPFNPSTTISFGLPSQSHVTVKVYSILGQEVATLMDGVQEAGYHNAVWNGHNNSGVQAASGVYLLRVMAQSTSGNASFTQVRKMILLK